MPIARRRRARMSARWACLAMVSAILGARAGVAAEGPFEHFDLPREWQERFWSEPGAQAILKLEPKALAALVPAQAGLRHCRCPSCEAPERDDPLEWSAVTPEVVVCRQCRAKFPNDKFPAKVMIGPELKVPEESVEVLPQVFHHYPYHGVEAERQLFPDERLYLGAKRDYEAREYLAKLALYAALKHRDGPPADKGPDYARIARVLILRFAQVYPAYATHYDQPGRPKYLQTANLPPPYRRGYGTAKWDWSGCLDVPLNLVVAYALVRDQPGWDEAGTLLGEPRPKPFVEQHLFRASAGFVLRQPEEYQEQSLLAYRGLLAVGRLLDDRALIHAAMSRIDGFAERGFTHDGMWRGADLASHRRVVAQLDGWLARLLPPDPPPPMILALAREIDGERASAKSGEGEGVMLASWPAPGLAPKAEVASRGPGLLGGAGLARLGVGRGPDALEIELRGFGDLGARHSNRLAIRLAVGGRTVLGDLDDLPATAGGFEHATASHNAVMVDGLNQRETTVLAQQPAAGSDCVFFAADPDFQVATMDDPRAYPISASRYRHTVVAASGPATRYAVGIFEVRGGLQHDQIFHAAPGQANRWQLSVPVTPGPATLLPPGIARVASPRAEHGRWFVQAMGEFGRLSHGTIDGPATADLQAKGAPGVRLHLFPEAPLTAFTGTTPDPTRRSPDGGPVAGPTGQAALLLRRRSAEGSELSTAFVTVFESTGAGTMPLRRVGRVASPAGTVVLALETADGPEHLVVNLNPGTRTSVTLADGGVLETDGLVVRADRSGLAMAGGTEATLGDLEVRGETIGGTIREVIRRGTSDGRGVFVVDGPVPSPESLAGRVLLIRHGKGPVRGWTLDRVEPPAAPGGPTRLVVREEAGFGIDPANGQAHYYQVPRASYPGPHTFRIARIARTTPPR